MKSNLWTLNHTLCPKTASTGWKEAAETIFFIRFDQIAPTAEGARREIKLLDTLSEGHVFWQIPQIIQILPHHVAN
jgi:hypothetical protein